MTVVCCPSCKSDLTEPGKNGNIECLYCGDEFTLGDGIAEEVEMSRIKERLEVIHSKKALRR